MLNRVKQLFRRTGQEAVRQKFRDADVLEGAWQPGGFLQRDRDSAAAQDRARRRRQAAKSAAMGCA